MNTLEIEKASKIMYHNETLNEKGKGFNRFERPILLPICKKIVDGTPFRDKTGCYNILKRRLPKYHRQFNNI